MRSASAQRNPLKVLIYTALLCLFASCPSCTSTLVDYSAEVHVVAPGETLYSIAWRHGLNHNDLARWNGLSNPDLLLVGQRLRLRPGVAARPAATVGAPPAATPRPPPSGNSRTLPPATAVTPPPARPLPAPVQRPPPRWQWPAQGSLIRRFGSSGGLVNGIGIAGRVGQEIRAAAAGRVVYAGNGLPAYGQLIIINHNDSFLSAYGYNDELVVTQGQDIGAGQVIARMGLGPERQPQLHFEIRQNGTPVDPLLHLPH